MTLRLISYDIEDNKCRTKIADHLLEWGLYRLQYSVFCGKHNKDQWKKIWQRTEALLKDYGDPEKDKVYAIILSEDLFEKMLHLGLKPETELILDKKQTLWM